VRSVCALLAALSISLALPVGCSALIPPSAAESTVSPDCRYYDDSFMDWQAVGIAAGSLGGASGASGLLSSALDGSEVQRSDWRPQEPSWGPCPLSQLGSPATTLSGTPRSARGAP